MDHCLVFIPEVARAEDLWLQRRWRRRRRKGENGCCHRDITERYSTRGLLGNSYGSYTDREFTHWNFTKRRFTMLPSATASWVKSISCVQGSDSAESKLMLTGLTKSFIFFGALSTSSALREIECSLTVCLKFRLIRSCSSQSLARKTPSSSRTP